MAKRRRGGNKKRRDYKRDSSAIDRIAKVGTVAATAAIGGAAVLRSDLGKRFINSGLTEAAIKAGKGFKRDLLNKPKNLRTLKDAYDRNIGKGGKLIKEAAANRSKTVKAGSASFKKKLVKAVETKNITLTGAKASDYNKAKKAFKEAASKKVDEAKVDKLHNAIDEIYSKISKENIEDKSILHYADRFKDLGMDEDATLSFLDEMLDWRERHHKTKDQIVREYGNLAKKIQSDELKNISKDKGDNFFDKIINTFTSTRALTVEDLEDFKNIDFGRATRIGKFEDGDPSSVNINWYLKKIRESRDGFDYEDFKDTVIDRGLRVSVDKHGNKQLVDYRETAELFEKVRDKFANSLPGKIMLKNFDLGDKTSFGILKAGLRDANAYLTGAGDDNILEDMLIYQGGKLRGITRDVNGVASIDEGVYAEVRQVTGWRQKVVQEFLGTQQQPKEANQGWISKVLDINQGGDFNVGKRIERMLNKSEDPNFEKNQLEAMKKYVNDPYEISDMKDRVQMYQNAYTTSNILNRNIKGVSDQTLDALIEHGGFNEIENRMLGLLLDGSEESLNEFISTMTMDTRGVKNKRLSHMLSSIINDVEATEGMSHISIKKGRHNFLFDMAIDEQWERNELGQFRVEYVKELLLKDDAFNQDFMTRAARVATNDPMRESLEAIGMLGVFEKYMDLGESIPKDLSSRFIIGSNEDSFISYLNDHTDMKTLFNSTMDDAIKDYSFFGGSKPYMGSLNETNLYSEYNDITLVRNSRFSGKAILESINEAIRNRDPENTKGAATVALEQAKAFGKELMAGKYDPGNITEITMLAQYSMSRLNYSLNEFGLGLSSDSMSSPLATYLNFGLKRVLPIAGAIGTYSYLNDESRRFLGSSITEAAARGASYVDIAARKFAYSVPIPKLGKVGEKIDDWAETSVIHEYWFGSNHFDTAEERRDWYENGYSPVRKGRFWSFGSSNEFRGGSITYWQPNFLRRAESNYRDISIYGSSEEKWAHSWIPTPTHPLSTVRALLNPYWLEKKHLKEGDRPYPVSSKLFTEGTPWGAILNPTIGEILKPVRMMPEAKLRLGYNGRDSKAVINRINERIKSKGQQNEDLIIVSGTDVRNAEYVPYGQPSAGEANFTIRNGTIESPGYNFMETVPNFGSYAPPEGGDFVQSVRGGGQVLVNTGDGLINPNALSGMTNYGDVRYAENIGKSIITNINNALKSGKTRSAGVMNDPAKSTYIYRNLINEYSNYMDSYYGERHDPTMVRGRQYDLMRDAMYSTGQISGIYGYLGRLALGSRDTYTFRYESAEQMNSFSRTFWDASIGGLGWGPMEIARRFFPSDDKNRINVNPLVNNMPDWIPDSYRTGDPFTKIPKGEMRLPGKGYEAMYDLHPDQFGDYGAFDRYKILADIAPNSKEYKKWRNIAKATVTDENLKKEMRNIAGRVSRMAGNHEFFDYQYINNKTQYSKGIVKAINGSNVVLTDNTILSLAGVETTNETVYGLQSQLALGQEITYRHDKNKAYSKENPWDSYTTAAVIYAKGSSTSINKSLIDSGYALKDVEDNSAIGQLGRISPTQELSGAIQEAIAHAPIPVVHNKFLKVETAYESYMKETYYGSNFKVWDHPIKGWIAPMFNEQSGKSLLSEGISLLVAQQHFSKYVNSEAISKIKGIPVKEKWLSNLALVTTNPTAFLFGNMSYIFDMSIGGRGEGQELTNWQRSAKVGVAAGAVKYAWDNADNPFKSMATMAATGAYLGARDFAWDTLKGSTLEKVFGELKGSGALARAGKGAAIGIGVGLALSAIKNPDFNKERMFGKWAPRNTRKKWELDEYFDRLEYIKYSGLYERAAARARRKEKVDVESIFEQVDKNKEKIAKLNRKAAKITSKMQNPDDKYGRQLAAIEAKKQALEEQSTMMFEGGEYTKSAIAYKKAMESTMYGISETATMDELLAAVPDQYKDHFQAFMQITDEKERKKILKSVSPMMRRPLQAAWGMKLERVNPNSLYFTVHALPGTGWRGWRPNVNLKHVKMKTIENEGMLLSEFGYYESEKGKTTFEDAPDIENYGKKGTIFNTLKLQTELKGHGLHLRNVSVEKSRAPGIRIIGDVKERVEDRTDATMYRASKIAYKLGSLF